MTMTRRGFLAASALTAIARPLDAFAAVTSLPRDADVVVVGAGAAGIAAARKIAAGGRKVVVIEATGQIGGRCQTDTATFGVPFDRGAARLYIPESNPLAKLARGASVDIANVTSGQKMRIGRRNARAGEAEDFLATLVRANRAIDDYARMVGRIDLACAAVLPKDLGDWQGASEFVLGPMATGRDLKDLSVMDQFRAQDRDAVAVARQGIGALVAKLAEPVPVVLSSPVTRIVWSGRDLQVETQTGKVAARAIIVTVSTAVLNSGKIKFAPDLPKRQLDAASRLPLGNTDRIALEIPGNPFGLGRDDVLIEQSTNNRTAALFANVNGSSLCTVDVAGAFGRELSGQGEAAMVAFAKEWLTKLFGGDAVAQIKRTAVTRWDAAPYVMGAMSGALPGAQPMRRVLAEPLGGLFFAGEATHETLYGTVGGAWESGERAADSALRRLGGVKEPDANPQPQQAKKRRPQRQRVAPTSRDLLGPTGSTFSQ